MKLRGWNEVTEFTGIHAQMLQRFMALRGFPRPVRVREKSITVQYWDRVAVMVWMEQNENSKVS